MATLKHPHNYPTTVFLSKAHEWFMLTLLRIFEFQLEISEHWNTLPDQLNILLVEFESQILGNILAQKTLPAFMSSTFWDSTSV